MVKHTLPTRCWTKIFDRLAGALDKLVIVENNRSRLQQSSYSGSPLSSTDFYLIKKQ